MKYASPEEAGWDSRALESAEHYFQKFGSAAVFVVYQGAVLASWGDVSRRFNCHSVRKSYLSTLLGAYVESGSIDLNKTMDDLGIDDIPPLTAEEKKARLIDLLRARSGIYHPAAYETASMKKGRPRRGSHLPGSFWYYNNWDFNTLVTIFNQETGRDFLNMFNQQIAIRLRMEDFHPRDSYYHYTRFKSIHPAYPFRMSARDMARFGLLVLNEGRWGGRQIIPSQWVREMIRIESKTNWTRGDYGYMWWIRRDPDLKKQGTISAIGAGGHSIDILPGLDMVFVHRVDTYQGKSVSRQKRDALLKMIIKARINDGKTDPALIEADENRMKPEAVLLSRDRIKGYCREYKNQDGERVRIDSAPGGMWLLSSLMGNFRLIPQASDGFRIADLGISMTIKIGRKGKPTRMEIIDAKGRIDAFYPAKPSFLPLLRDAILNYGIEGIEKRYLGLKRDTSNLYDFSETELNRLGYELLWADRITDAIRIFELNVSVFPDSYNPHDSLGEAYLKSGNLMPALASYRQAARLNPQQNTFQKHQYQKQLRIIKKLSKKK